MSLHTAISIYVVGSKLQGYGTRPKGGMGRLELILGFRGCRLGVANSHVDSVTPFRNMILLCQRSSHFSNNKQGSACSQPAVSQLITLL